MPGTLVDVVVVIEPANNNAKSESVFKIVLQKIKVLASNQRIDHPEKEKEAQWVPIVTVQVTPEQAEKFALASTVGKLQLRMSTRYTK